MRQRLIAIAGFAALLAAHFALAVDGTIEINHVRALAGGVTPGDTAGYPVTISQPGSYRLTSNLIVPDSASGVEVEANDVNLDLNGFAILGSLACTGTPVTSCTGGALGNGVWSASTNRNTRVANGTVAGMLRGVAIDSSGRVERVAVHDNHYGIVMMNGEIAHCAVDQNAEYGIAGSVDGRIDVSYTRVSGNGLSGIAADFGRISDSSVTENGGDGITLYSGGAARDNVVRANTGYGIRVSGGTARLSGNYLSANTGGTITGTALPAGANTCGTLACP